MKKQMRKLRLVEGHGFDHEIVDDAAELPWAVAQVRPGDGDTDEGLALARLFVAAPELLAAAEEVVRIQRENGDWSISWNLGMAIERLDEAVKAASSMGQKEGVR